MLPEEMEVAQLDAIRRHVQKEACGLHSYTCAICGKQFEAGAEYRYRLKVGKKQNTYCSHRCFRVDEVKEAERFKRETLGRWVWSSSDLTEVQRAKKRLSRTRERLAGWQARKDDPGFAALPKAKKTEIENGIAKWIAREVLDMEAVEEARRKCNTKNF